MSEGPEEPSEREKATRYWAPRVVPIVFGFVVLIAGFWSAGRDWVAFLANWSTFVLQVSAFYLFVFEREFLANLWLDFLDFVQRARAYRARRAAAREAAQAARRAEAETAAAAEAHKPKPAASKSPAPPSAPPTAPIPQPTIVHEPPPRFKSRDNAFPLRALIVIGFIAVAGLLLFNAFQGSSQHVATTDTGTATTTTASANNTTGASVTTTAPNTGTTTTTTTAVAPTPWPYSVKADESCWVVAERASQSHANQVATLWVRIVNLNPTLCPTDRDQVLQPETILQIPGDIPRSALAAPE